MNSSNADTNPLVSVVIPTYNSEKHIECALDSVLRQSYPVLEIIVVDDSSTDGTVDVVTAHKAVSRVVRRSERGGPGAARNDGVAESQGTHIAFLDADDYWADDKVEHQVNALLHNPGTSMATCIVSEFHDSALSDAEKARMPIRHVAAAIPSTILIDKSAFYAVGAFAIDHGDGSESVQWGLAVQEAGITVLSIAEAIVYRRLHAHNTSRLSRATQHSGYLHAIKASLDRRRKNDR